VPDPPEQPLVRTAIRKHKGPTTNAQSRFIGLSLTYNMLTYLYRPQGSSGPNRHVCPPGPFVHMGNPLFEPSVLVFDEGNDPI
jgi:hypothetical protein